MPPIFLGMRHAIYALLNWGPYHYGPLRLRLPMEWQKELIAYIILTGGFAFYFHLKESRLKALREVELSAKLQEARLQALSAQLDPHFLFNALNTISSVMYESLERTDRLLASLGQMLRDGLEGESALWPLERELSHLDAFLDFALARFGSRLQVRVQVEPGLSGQAVPRFCLQRLAENAIKHNLDRIGQVLFVEIEVKRNGEWLRLMVQDDGVGFKENDLDATNGIGLRNLRETLALGYGGSATLEILDRPEGGAQVILEIPMESSRA
jgi:two-component system, LytTR family, sensor kinase